MSRRLASVACAAALLGGSLASCRVSQDTGAAAGVKRAVRAYVAAIDARDGARLCEDLSAEPLRRLDVPKRRGSCASSLAASIGYQDPRGYPVWRRTELKRFRSLDVGEVTARATVRVKTIFADKREPSLEDDVIYLTRADGRWMIAKPSATLYRAIGAGTPPLSALRAPSDTPG